MNIGILKAVAKFEPIPNPNFYGNVGRKSKVKDVVTFDKVCGATFPKHGVKFEFETTKLGATKAKVEVEISRLFFNPIEDGTNHCYTFFHIGEKVFEVFFYVNDNMEIDGGLQINMWNNVVEFESDDEVLEVININEEDIKRIDY